MDNKNSKFDRVINVLSSIALPAAIAFSGYYVSSSIEKSKVKSEYVKIAVGILAKDIAQPQDGSQEVIREWAVKVLDKNSPVALSDKEKRVLVHSDNALLMSFMDEDPELKIKLISESFKALEEMNAKREKE